MLFSDFTVRGPRRIPTRPIVALTEFFLADVETIAGVVISNIFAMYVSVFLYAYYVCYDLSPKLLAPVVGLFYLRF